MRDPRKVVFNIVVSLVCFVLMAIMILFAGTKARAEGVDPDVNTAAYEDTVH